MFEGVPCKLNKCYEENGKRMLGFLRPPLGASSYAKASADRLGVLGGFGEKAP